MKCKVTNCSEDSVCAVALLVPAKGCPIAEHDPLRVVIGMTLCETHFAAATPDIFLKDNVRLKKILQVQTEGRKLAPPDYDRATLERVELDSPEWMMISSRN